MRCLRGALPMRERFRQRRLDDILARHHFAAGAGSEAHRRHVVGGQQGERTPLVEPQRRIGDSRRKASCNDVEDQAMNLIE